MPLAPRAFLAAGVLFPLRFGVGALADGFLEDLEGEFIRIAGSAWVLRQAPMRARLKGVRRDART